MRKVYILPFVVRIEVKLSMFHYKIIHNILCTKSLLLEERRLPTVPSLSSRSHHHSVKIVYVTHLLFNYKVI